MAVTHCGIRTHHVDVFAAVDIPHQAVARALDHHRQGSIVARTPAVFLANEILRFVVLGFHDEAPGLKPLL
jgi:hypothetical protein